jgi:hypothetical protein
MIASRETHQIKLQIRRNSGADYSVTLSENRIPHLLKLAGVSSSDRAAAAWLNEAIAGTRHNYRAAKQRPLAVDHNTLLADIEKSAKELTKRIARLRRYPSSRHLFWRSQAFGPVHRDRVEVREVLSTLESIARAADLAKDRRQGRRREAGKQHVVDMALGFFHRFSPQIRAGPLLAHLPRLPVSFIPLRSGLTPSDMAVLTAK